MRGQIVALVAMTVGSFSCSGEPVELNERLVDARTGASLGGGCSTYMLGSGETVGGAGTALEFDVAQWLDGDAVVFEIKRGVDVVATRRYSEAFFRAGGLDELVVPSRSGTEMTARHWGTFHPDPTGCTSLEQTGPRL